MSMLLVINVLIWQKSFHPPVAETKRENSGASGLEVKRKKKSFNEKQLEGGKNISGFL
jgi:hypothetical protein